MIILLLTACISLSAFAVSAKFQSPQLGHPHDAKESDVKQIYQMLDFMKEHLQFIEGSFFNEFTSQRFGGSPKQVVQFLDKLKASGLWQIHVRFHPFKEQTSAFTLQQHRPEILNVTINVSREDFLLRDFAAYLPKPGELAAGEKMLRPGMPPNAEDTRHSNEAPSESKSKVEPNPNLFR